MTIVILMFFYLLYRILEAMDKYFSSKNHNPSELNVCINSFLQAEALFNKLQEEVCKIRKYCFSIIFNWNL